MGTEAEGLFNFSFWGYVLPGFLITIQGFFLKGTILNGEVRWLPIGSFILSGIFFALAGFLATITSGSSFSAVVHEVGILGSFFFFVVAGLTISDQLKADQYWRPVYWKQIVLVWLAVIFIIIRGIESIDGLAQKLYYLTYFLWAAVFSIKAMTLRNNNLSWLF
ncbi:MAG: hypothetical protein O2887_14230 [Bacteroidetes bacterium]|nr:hypothetical protein [Bacteroidota bacterium]MDA1121627.1 hypothetical protein [Bacteroidota bacterium]